MTQTMLDSEQIKTLLGSDLPADYTLNSIYEIENLLIILKSIDEKVQFYKELKKFRTKSIDEKVDQLEERSDRLRSVVLHTMQKLEPTKRSFNFPAIATVTRKKNPDNWNVTNEDELRNFLEEYGYKDDVFQTREVLDTRNMKRVLNDLTSASITPAGVEHKKGVESISIKFESTTPALTSNAVADESTKALDALDGITADDL